MLAGKLLLFLVHQIIYVWKGSSNDSSNLYKATSSHKLQSDLGIVFMTP
jgi:hypothetical protein